MLIEAAKGCHTTVVQMLIDYPNSLVAPSLAPPSPDSPAQVTPSVVESSGPPPGPPPELEGRVPPPGSEALTPPKSVLRKGAAGQSNIGGSKTAVAGQGGVGATGGLVLPDSGYDFLEGSGFVLEGLEEKGLDAKSYIQVILPVTI